MVRYILKVLSNKHIHGNIILIAVTFGMFITERPIVKNPDKGSNVS